MPSGPTTTTIACFVTTVALVACSPGPRASSQALSGAVYATATLAPTQGHSAAGRIRLQSDGDRVRLTGFVTGLSPGRQHGFHIHERGDCSSPDASSAGEHFDPAGSRGHGGPEAARRHAGDLPNLQADASGRAEVALDVGGVTLGTGATGVTGRALVVHAQPDDYRSQPAGGSGDRIACAVIAAG